jgi:dihydroorotate dehydrogenase electron transfer subunit
MLQLPAELIERQIQGPSQELKLRAPELARQLSPGRAVLVRAGWGQELYLRRTFYPIALDDETWTLRLPPGDDWGHAWLRTAPLGVLLDCLGPVGNGYSLSAGVRNVLCAGEGDKSWALLPAVTGADALGLSVALAAEGITYRDLIPPHRLPATVEYRMVATDGGYGRDGLGSFPREWLLWADALLAAGSMSFYLRLADAVRDARYGLTRGFAQVLYPATFLCGTGACQACVADMAGRRRRVCLRGPVFDLLDIATG